MTPLEQFRITRSLAGGTSNTLGITAAYSVALVCVIVVVYFVVVTSEAWGVRGCGEFFARVAGLVRQHAGVGTLWTPWIVYLALIILLANTQGLVPGAFTVTGQCFFTFFLSCVSFVGILLAGFCLNGFNTVRMLIPRGIDGIGLLGFLFLIEIVSFVIRPCSLAIRLFANMLAGHTLLHIISGAFGFLSLCRGTFSSIWLSCGVLLACGVVSCVLVLEFFVAAIQTYVFVVLYSVYVGDILYLGH